MNFGKYEPISIIYDMGGILLQFKFNNNYGASVIRHDFSYGSKDGLWELAVLKFEDSHYRTKIPKSDLCYDTPITDDVLGYLTEKDVEKYLEQIEKL